MYKHDDKIIQIFKTILSSGIALTLSLTTKFDVKTDFTNSKIKKSKLSNKVINHCCLTILIQLLMKI